MVSKYSEMPAPRRAHYLTFFYGLRTINDCVKNRILDKRAESKVYNSLVEYLHGDDNGVVSNGRVPDFLRLIDNGYEHAAIYQVLFGHDMGLGLRTNAKS